MAVSGIRALMNPYKPQTYKDEYPVLLPYLAVFVFVFALWGLVLNTKSIKVDQDGVKVRYIFFPFFSKRYLWSDFEYIIKVKERFRYTDYQALWFIKNNRCIMRFNSRQFSNFRNIQNALKPKIALSREFSNRKILAAFLGIRVQID